MDEIRDLDEIIAEFNDPKNFPSRDGLSSVIMLDDESLEVRTQSGPPRISTAVFNCPKATKMYEYILSITGPLTPGGSWLYLSEVDFDTYYE